MLDRARIAADLRRLLPSDAVVDQPSSLRVFETDALTAYRQMPLLVALPTTTAEVAAVMRYCHDNQIKIVPRGAGTSLSGGALPLADGVLLSLTRMNRILEIDYENRCVVAQPGVTNLSVTHAVQDKGFYYAPDPSSQLACTLGGNVAENAGGVHCLKYGMTAHNILGLEMVLPDGNILRLGGKGLDAAGYDLLGVAIGSEGMLGIVTEITVRILRRPQEAQAVLLGFPEEEAAGACVAAIIAAGIIPAGMEMMDRAATEAVEAYIHADYPLDAAALLIVEADGIAADVASEMENIEAIARHHGATTIRRSRTEAERLKIWAGRKAAFPAVGRLAPDYLCMDGTIPRARLPDVLREIRSLAQRYDLKVANVFHAGDGNLHPLIMYDANDPKQLQAAEALGADILKFCVSVGGVLTGEHGVGIEKKLLMPFMFNEAELNQQQRLKCAFDADGLLNPGKVFPQLHRCADLGWMHVHHGQLPHRDLERL